MAATLLAPAGADAKRRVFGERTLKMGMRGTDVRVLQDFLTRAGFHAAVDGQFGRGTRRSVRGWERSARRRVNGIVSRSDAQALRVQLDETGSAQEQSTTTTTAPAGRATIGPDGRAIAPADAPDIVKRMIEAGNAIHDKPYKYGGGHGNWNDSGYDCSGSMSYVYHAVGLLNRALDSTGFMSWGEAGKGRWVTNYANSGHSYMIIAGLRFDTSGRVDDDSRWDTRPRSSAGYAVRHPPGL